MAAAKRDARQRAAASATRVSHRQLNLLAAVAFIGTAVVACGGTTTAGTTAPDLSASAHLMSVDELAAGQLGSLPTGSQFARIVVFHQSPRQTVPSKKHQAGIIYVEAGLQLLTYTGGQSVDISAGMAVYLKSVAHSHTALGPTDSTWYFVALWPSVQRSNQLVPGAQIAFEAMDIPSTTLPPGSYIETLRKATLQTGGRSPAHRFGGLEVVFVLDGTLTVKVAAHSSVQLIAGEGTSVAPGIVTQELAAGTSKVDYLAFFVTPQAARFETDVASAPSG
jgi:quercetin dioxygenase-like cupin family protein